jgi:hypothetical protein
MTPICYSCSVDIPRPSVIVTDLLAFLQVAKTDRQLMAPPSAGERKDHSIGRPQFAIRVLQTLLVQLQLFVSSSPFSVVKTDQKQKSAFGGVTY